MERFSLFELHDYVKRGGWENNSSSVAAIFVRYLELSRQYESTFGTPLFWATVAGVRMDEIEGTPQFWQSVAALWKAGINGRSTSVRPVRSSSTPAVRRSHPTQPAECSGVQPSAARLIRSASTPPVQSGGLVQTRSARQLDAQPTYRFVPGGSVYIKELGTCGEFFKLQFLSDETPLETVRAAISEAIKKAFAEKPNAMVGMELKHEQLDKPILIRFSDKEKLTTDNVLNLIDAVLQSAECVQMGSEMDVKIVSYERPAALGRKRGIRLLGAKAPSVAKITKNDGLCVARSLIYSIARLEKTESEAARRRWITVQKGDKSKCAAQRKGAQELMKLAGIPLGTRCGITELGKLQEHIGYQIKAWDIHLRLLYEGPLKEKQIYLLFDDDDHCSPIKSITMFMNRNYFCNGCNVGYSFKTHHRCEAICKHCLKEGGDCVLTEWQKCADCRRFFPSVTCFDRHKILQGKQKKAVCQQMKVCIVCSHYVYGDSKHHCGQTKCGSCKQFDDPEQHQLKCYMQPIVNDGEEEETGAKRRRVDKGAKGYIFFDFESRQDEQLDDGSFKHRVNYCVVQKACLTCHDTWAPDDSCYTCGKRQLVFEGDGTTELFCKWLLTPEHIDYDYLVFAHNLGGYDGQFILEYAVRNAMKPQIIPRGLSLMALTIQGIRFLDSFSFLPMGLAALPKVFGFDGDVLKGYFPHLFNTVENQQYVGPYPEPKFYMADGMKPEKKSIFMEWHNKQKGKEFNFKKEMENYCTDDVNILRRAVLAFREIFYNNTAVDPYEHSITIASACSLVFRTHYLEAETIGIVPHQGYRRNDRQSVVALQWLKWLADSREIEIQHARNIGEKWIPKDGGHYKADGFCAKDNKVFEFNGCLFHGCPCIKNRRKTVPGSGLSMEEAYNRTLEKKRHIISMGYSYEEIWGCEFDRAVEDDPKLAAFISTLDLVLPLDPRGAFFGGRTNAIVLDKTVKEGEKIKYVDFVSLYPTVQKQHQFPLGHPDIITENFQPITAANMPYFGLIKCDVLPPTQLYHPVLPVRCGGKLQFPLCRICATLCQDDCNHTDKERVLKGEWVSVELEKAVKLGYEVVKVHEVWQYDRRSDPTERGTFFGGYVDSFLKLKAEASGFPSWVQTEADKDAFVHEFGLKEGVALEKSKIKKNPGLRQIAKLCLNSFWGKFGQRNNLPNSTYFSVSDKKAYCELMEDPANEINSINFAGDQVVCVSYTRREAYVDALPNTSPVIAAFTTAWARLRLYGCLEQLQERVLYFDTDSVVYINTGDPEEWEPQLGETLGAMTDELEKDYGPGAYCDHFVGAGPKNYALSVVNGDKRDTIVKIRGFTLNWSASQKLNFESMFNMMMGYLNPDKDSDELGVTLEFPQITRSLDRTIVTKNVHKNYKIVYNKRKIMPDGRTLPWGYKQ